MGIVGGGGRAEELGVHERDAVRVSDRMSLDEAAAIPEAFMTAHDALFTRLALGAGETVLIHAVASGVGTAALQLAQLAGAKTIGTSRSPAKLGRARKLGLDVEIDASSKDWAAQVEASIGVDRVDAVLDLVGSSYVEGHLRVMAQGGRWGVV